MSNARNLANLLGTDTKVQTADIADAAFQANKNLIINGAMQVAQRGTSFTRTTSTFTVDRMEWVMNTSTCVISQSTDVPSGQGFANSLKVSPSVANGSLSASHVAYLRYGLEGQDLQQLAKGTSLAKKVTLSFWLKTNKVGTYQLNLRDHDNARLIGKTFTPASSGVWEKFEITFDGDTVGAFDNDNNRSLSIGWWFAAGSTYTSGAVPTSWEALDTGDRAAGVSVNFLDSTSNELYLTGVKLEVGSTATDFVHRSYGEELALCQRYYQLSGRGSGIWFDATSFRILLHHAATMRAAPTAAIFDSNAYHEYWGASGYNGISSIAYSSTGGNSSDLRVVSSSNRGRSYADPAIIERNAISLDAEL